MSIISSISKAIDWFNEQVGQLSSWLALVMVLLGAYNAVGRYLGKYFEMNLSSNALMEAQWYLFSAVFLLGASQTLKMQKHVRVDIFYGKLSVRGQATVDIFGHLFALIPFCLAALYFSWPTVMNSVSVLEVSADPDGLARYPIKLMMLAAFGLLALQAISETIKSAQTLIYSPPSNEGVK